MKQNKSGPAGTHKSGQFDRGQKNQPKQMDKQKQIQKSQPKQHDKPHDKDKIVK